MKVDVLVVDTLKEAILEHIGEYGSGHLRRVLWPGVASIIQATVGVMFGRLGVGK